MDVIVISCMGCGEKVTASKKATRLQRCKKCAKERILERKRLARRLGRIKARPGAPPTGLREQLKKGEICVCCNRYQIFPGLRYLCYDCWENWGDNVVNARDDKEIYRHLKKLTKIEEGLKRGLSNRATILTTSPETLLRYPNAIMVNQRYAKHYVGNKTVNFFPGLGG